MSSILVTGANGFVGAALCRALLQRGHQVIGTVRNKNRLPEDILSEPDFSAIEIPDINQQTNWSPALEGVDVVVHLAARVHQLNDTSSQAQELYDQVNRAGASELARQSQQFKVKKFIFISTIKVNGESTQHSSFNELSGVNPGDDYAVSKHKAEQEILSLGAKGAMEIVILRPPLVYGPGVKANFLKLANALKKNLPLPLRCVKNQRSMIFLGNLIDIISAVVESKQPLQQIYVVSDGESVSTSTLVQLMAQALNKKDRLWPCPLILLHILGRLLRKSNEVKRLVQSLEVDSQAIFNDLKIAPRFSVKEGIEQTLAALDHE